MAAVPVPNVMKMTNLVSRGAQAPGALCPTPTAAACPARNTVTRLKFARWAGVGNMMSFQTPSPRWATLRYLFTRKDSDKSSQGRAIDGITELTKIETHNER